MSLRSQVWDLLKKHEGEWVPRSEIERVGGAEGTRRLREIREKTPGYDIERRGDEYRLVAVTIDADWACTRCGAPPKGEVQRSVDERWRLGRCPNCGAEAVFKRA